MSIVTNPEVDPPPAPIVAKGLENVVALESELSYVDGQAGDLVYRGYHIHDLAEHVGFEETAFLLWNGHLPNRAELAETTRMLQSERNVPSEIITMLRSVPKDAEPSAVLRTGASALALFDPEAQDSGPEANYRKAIRLTAKLPTILAAYDRIRKGLYWIPPRRDGTVAEEFLYMLNGEQPGEMAVRAFDLCLVLHADHGLNASTFTARVVGSTLSDMYSGVVAAIGALKGPLHGGANIEVMKMLLEIRGSSLDVADYVRAKLARKERIMGFGHRVYKTMDPRATSLRRMLTRLSEEKEDTYWLDTAVKMMETMKGEKDLNPNVDFFSAPVYYLLGIEIDLYTPIFAISRVAGWTAHLLEQWDGNRLIRPRLAYVGQKNLKVVPIDKR
ncbi:MAG TPA: citrate synthase [Rhodothermia bacterium]